MEESSLYPLKFLPLFKNKVWGGNKIKELGFDYDPLPNCGELWALSGMPGNESVISNGFLAENTLSDALEIYMGELLGEKNYLHFGNDFPLLIKLIDASDLLSIQVHPDDSLAQERGMENGKTEMWYVIEAEKGATLIDGFSQQINAEEFQHILSLGHLEDFLHTEQPQKGDVFFIPAGRIHAIGKGLLLAEIQQASDCTYRIYDYNRTDSKGKKRPLHIREALDAIQYDTIKDGKCHYNYQENNTTHLVSCHCFNTNLISLTKPVRKDFHSLDSFVVYFCVEGIAAIKSMEHICPVHAGECVLVPAVADTVELFSEGPAKLLEIYIDPAQWKEEDLRHQNDFDWLAQFIGTGQPEAYLDDLSIEDLAEIADNYEEPDEDDDCQCGHHHDDHCGCGHHHHDDDCDCGHHHNK